MGYKSLVFVITINQYFILPLSTMVMQIFEIAVESVVCVNLKFMGYYCKMPIIYLCILDSFFIYLNSMLLSSGNKYPDYPSPIFVHMEVNLKNFRVHSRCSEGCCDVCASCKKEIYLTYFLTCYIIRLELFSECVNF